MAAGGPRIACHTIAFPDFSLEDQSSTPGVFDTVIRRAGARPAFYMVWPAASRQGDFEAVPTSYAAAARAVHGVLLPVGQAWRAAWQRDSHVELYDSDGFHPSPLASYLAALVIYQQVSGRSPQEMPQSVVPASRGFSPIVVPPARASLLRAAATEAIAWPASLIPNP